jgi:hypothetical protein
MPSDPDPFLTVVLNLSQFHREHEKYYTESPLHESIALSRTSNALKALAERWSTVQPDEAPLPSPFAGAVDLNDDRAIELLGVLFMEGAGEPAEITRMKSDLAAHAGACRSTGEWLAKAMEASWGVVERLVAYPGAADLLGDRHRIISNDWQCASLSSIAGRNIDRALTVLAQVEFTPAALRADLSGSRIAPRYLFAASELVDHAADLLAQSSVITRDNERRWRVFHQRIREIIDSPPGPARTGPPAALDPTLPEAGPGSFEETVASP